PLATNQISFLLSVLSIVYLVYKARRRNIRSTGTKVWGKDGRLLKLFAYILYNLIISLEIEFLLFNLVIAMVITHSLCGITRDQTDCKPFLIRHHGKEKQRL